MIFVDFTLIDGTHEGYLINLNSALDAVAQAQAKLDGKETQGVMAVRLTVDTLREMVADQGRVASLRSITRRRTQSITMKELRNELA